jgi:hypothetical protein
MRHGLIAAAVGLVCVFVPQPGDAWSFEVHRFVTEQAIALLPPEIRPFFEKHRVMIVEHSIGPDLWRNAGFEEEPPQHFLDIDAYGKHPFSELPRDYGEAIRKFGPDKIKANGLLPWRTEEMYARLLRSFVDQKSGNAGFAPENIKFFAAVLSHYVADAHVPFHAVVNYNGQLTNQHGVHDRFEGALFGRYRDRLNVTPTPLAPVRNVRDFVFDALIESARLAESVLEADRRALGDTDAYDDRYFEAFLKEMQPMLERRLADSIAAVAATITGAWEEAGRPELPVDPVRRIQRKRPTETN